MKLPAMKLPTSATNQCQWEDRDGRCETRRIKLGRSGYCKTHQQQQDEADANASRPQIRS